MNARDYLFEREPARLALVVGNSDYEHLGPLHSAKFDAKEMSTRLKQLGFTVTLVTRLSSVRHFEDDILPAFRNNIQRGDLVVFYFSGHGFAYGPDNYIAPADLPPVVPGPMMGDHGIAVAAIEDYFARQSPGVVVMLIDACRAIAGFVIKESGTQNLVPSGLPAHVGSPERINTIEGYAARAGSIAIASTTGTELSPFTKSLSAHIEMKGVELSEMFRDVAADVLLATNQSQTPGIVSWSTSEVYLNPTDGIRAREKEAWVAALSSGSREVIERFSYRRALSRHAGAACLWLKDHQVQKQNDGKATAENNNNCFIHRFDGLNGLEAAKLD